MRMTTKLAGALALALTMNAQAVTNVRLQFSGNGGDFGAVCTDNSLNYTYAATGNNDDGGGADWFAIVESDGVGTLLNNTFLSVPVGGSVNTVAATDFGAIAGSTVRDRAIYVRLYDIGNPNALVADAQAGVSFALGGTLRATASQDLGAVHGNCKYLPANGVPYNVPTLATGGLVTLAGLLGALGFGLLRRRDRA